MGRPGPHPETIPAGATAGGETAQNATATIRPPNAACRLLRIRCRILPATGDRKRPALFSPLARQAIPCGLGETRTSERN